MRRAPQAIATVENPPTQASSRPARRALSQTSGQSTSRWSANRSHATSSDIVAITMHARAPRRRQRTAPGSDLDIVRAALDLARRRDAHELGALVEFAQRARVGVAHRRAQATRQ